MRGPRARQLTRQGGALVIVAASALAAFTTLAAPAGAKSSAKPCKLLTSEEIASEFDGATVTGPTTGITTPVSAGCDWAVAATASRPKGTVSARLMTIGGKAAYNGLKTNSAYAPVPGLPKSLYQQQTGALSVLDGSTLVTVQGVFVSPTPPIGVVDVLPQVTALMKDALKRA